MVKDSIRKCSHCGTNGHNTRTCNGKGCFKLFGVKINVIEREDGEAEAIRKSKSMGNLQTCNAEHGGAAADAGYLSDGLIQSEKAKAAHERKKGVPWTEDEHRSFLLGLKKLGKGDWKGISKNYVPTRTPTQVASHAQKYFIRMSATEKKKRRTSLFDMPLKESIVSPGSPSNKTPEVVKQASISQLAPISEIQFKRQFSLPDLSADKSPRVPTSQRPPLSPMARTLGLSEFRATQNMAGSVSNSQNFHAATMSYFPMVNYTSQGYMYLPNVPGSVATCGPFTYQLPTDLVSQPLPPVPSQVAFPTSATKENGLEAGIGALSALSI